MKTKTENDLVGIWLYSPRALNMINNVIASNGIEVIDIPGDHGSALRVFFIDMPTFSRFLSRLPLRSMLQNDEGYDWEHYDTRSTNGSPGWFIDRETAMKIHNSAL